MIHPPPTAQTRFWFALSKVMIFMGAFFYMLSALAATYASFLLTTAVTSLSVGTVALGMGIISRLRQQHVSVPAITEATADRMPLAFPPRHTAASSRLGA